MKKWLLSISVCFVGLALVIGCGGGDGDGGSANLDAETEEVMEVMEAIMGDMGSFAGLPQALGAKRLAASVAINYPLNRAFFNEPVPLPAGTTGSAVRNGNMSGSISGSAGQTSGSVSLNGNYLTMITFTGVTTQGGHTISGRLSQGGTMSGSATVSLSNAGTGSFEFKDTISSQPDFLINGLSVSLLVETTYVITFANGNVTTSGHQMAIINGESFIRSF